MRFIILVLFVLTTVGCATTNSNGDEESAWTTFRRGLGRFAKGASEGMKDSGNNQPQPMPQTVVCTGQRSGNSALTTCN